MTLAEVEKGEARLGFKLPAALRDWYLISGYRTSEKVIGTESLREPQDLVVFDGVLVFYDEPQGTVAWGIRAANLKLDDPPVVTEGDAANVMPGPGWFEQNKSTTEFILQMEIKQTIFHADHTATGYCNNETADKIKSSFPQIGPNWYWVSYPTQFFWKGNILLEMYPAIPEFYGTNMTRIDAAARTKSALFDLIKRFPIAWERSRSE